jgi:hypothetical protein
MKMNMTNSTTIAFIRTARRTAVLGWAAGDAGLYQYRLLKS